MAALQNMTLLVFCAALFLAGPAAAVDPLKMAKLATRKKIGLSPDFGKAAMASIATKLAAKRAEEGVLDASSDVAVDGACKSEAQDLCGTIEVGNGRLASCLRSKKVAGIVRGSRKVLSTGCQSEVTTFFKAAAKTPFAFAPELKAACESNLVDLCGDAPEPMKLFCLRQNKVQLDEKCRAEVFKKQLEQAEDVRLDPVLSAACETDIDSLCAASVPAGEGRVKGCLRKNKQSLTSECSAILFKVKMEQAEDIRLDVPLKKACQAEMSTHCKDVEMGKGRIRNCLWDKRNEDNFSEDCKAKLTPAMEAQEADYRLDFRLRTNCADDIDQACSAAVAKAEVAQESGPVIDCLKKRMPQLKSQCRMEVFRAAMVHAADLNSDQVVKTACGPDVQRLCKGTAPQHLHKCLRSKMPDLSAECRAAEFAELKIESSSIDLKPEMEAACKREMRGLCKDVPKKDAQMIQCLQDHKDDEDGMSKACTVEIEADEELTATDWRLKWGISNSCQSDVNTLCADETELDAPKGAVLACLVRDRKQLSTDTGCKAEVGRLIRIQADNWKNNAELKAMCSDDVAIHCAGVEPGHGQVHACLTEKIDMLTPECRAEEFKEQQEEAEAVLINPMVRRSCRPLINGVCKDVKETTDGSLMRCLEDHKADEGTAKSCKLAVEGKSRIKNLDFRLNPMLKNSCTKDIDALCSSQKQDAQFYEMTGQVLQCLITKRDEIQSDACKASLARKQEQRASDISLDPTGQDKCFGDIAQFCDSVKRDGKGKGKVHQCLFEHLDELTTECKDYEFKMQAMKGENLRFNPVLAKACKGAVSKWCAGSEGPEKFKCLRDHQEEDDFPASCKAELVNKGVRGTSNIAFTPDLRKACRNDLQALKSSGKCATERGSLKNGQDILCLLGHKDDLTSDECGTRLVAVEKMQSNDMRLRPGLRGRGNLPQPCAAEADSVCPGVPPGGGKLNRCMQNNKEKLTAECAAVIGSIKSAEDKHFGVSPMARNACANEKVAFCDHIKAGSQRVWGCLKTHAEEDGFSDKCKAEVARVSLKNVVMSVLPAGASLSSAATKQIANQLANQLGGENNHDVSSIQISGWMALVALASLATLIGYGVYTWFKKSQRSSKAYTVVDATR